MTDSEPTPSEVVPETEEAAASTVVEAPEGVVEAPDRPPEPRRELVRVVGVSKKLLHEGREVHILHDVELSIDAGEMLCIVGPSGAGKSTLLHILGTLDLPTQGRIVFEGEDVTRYSSARLADFRNRHLGFVFQFHHLLPEFTALENVMMPGLIRGTARSTLERAARSLLDEVGLTHRLTHRPGELSGGEQQRVALARALVMEPKLILADEPTGNLDSKTSDAMNELFFDLNRRRGTTFLIVTHSRDLASLMPRVVRMSDGRIVADERKVPESREGATVAGGIVEIESITVSSTTLEVDSGPSEP